MTAPLRRIDIDAFGANVRRVRDQVAPAEVMVVVKDDAYRHGLGPVVRRALHEGVRWIGAFDVRTGESVMRDWAQLHPWMRVFVWSLGAVSDARRAVDAGVDIGIGDRAQLDTVAAAAATAGVIARVHLKIDTGLHRNGFRAEEWEDAVAAAAAAERAGTLRVEGIWSHIAEASDAEDDAARAAFDAAVEVARRAGLTPPMRHLAASAAAFARPEFRYDMVRVGAFAYGIRSAGGPSEEELGLTPVLTLSATVTDVTDAGVEIGIGSLDGLPSTLAGRAEVDTPAGPRALVRVGLDRSLVAAWPGATLGQEVVIYGARPHASRSATDLAELIDTIGEEIVLRTGE